MPNSESQCVRAFLVNKGKRKLFQLLLKNLCYQKAFIDLGVAHTTNMLNEVFKILEKFVCEMYGYNKYHIYKYSTI